ncbi:MAG: cisplatin damage response ATP-dependent DNA ligase [Hyphomicrobiales bacterium]
MRDFAALMDRLVYTPQRTGKERLLAAYFRAAPDPDRGYALAAFSDGLPLAFPLRRILGELAGSRFDPTLFRLSRDYVGDTAETLSLIWDGQSDGAPVPGLGEIVARLDGLKSADQARQLAEWLDRLDATGRWALLKFLSGAPRVGVSARLVRVALAQAFAKPVESIEEIWHGLSPPYGPLFDWLEGRAAALPRSAVPVFRPLMLAHALEEEDWEALDLDAMQVEWKWDGIRVQIAGGGGTMRLFSRSGDDITAGFPDLVADWRFDAVLDGELLVMRSGAVAPFADLQQRLNRRSVTRAMTEKFPVHVRLYDALEIGGEDLRPLPLAARRRRLEAWHEGEGPRATDLSPLIVPPSKPALREIWSETRSAGIEGLMLKRSDSPYLAGRPRGHWFKWKRQALTADCVLMYAQRGAGKRSSFYSDYTFGVWDERGGTRILVPVGKAYSGFTDAELRAIDRFVRDNTLERFGPVRSVEAKLVFEVAFDAIQPSARHKAGLAMRFPRISRIRWDKPAEEADELATLARLAEVQPG